MAVYERSFLVLWWTASAPLVRERIVGITEETPPWRVGKGLVLFRRTRAGRSVALGVWIPSFWRRAPGDLDSERWLRPRAYDATIEDIGATWSNLDDEEAGQRQL